MSELLFATICVAGASIPACLGLIPRWRRQLFFDDLWEGLVQALIVVLTVGSAVSVILVLTTSPPWTIACTTGFVIFIWGVRHLARALKAG